MERVCQVCMPVWLPLVRTLYSTSQSFPCALPQSFLFLSRMVQNWEETGTKCHGTTITFQWNLNFSPTKWNLIRESFESKLEISFLTSVSSLLHLKPANRHTFFVAVTQFSLPLKLQEVSSRCETLLKSWQQITVKSFWNHTSLHEQVF